MIKIPLIIRRSEGEEAMSTTRTPLDWIMYGEVGTSSKTIWAVMMGQATQPQKIDDFEMGYGIPHDPDDFCRCHKLLELFPEWRERLNEVSIVFPAWKPFVDKWDELEALFAEEYPQKRAPKLYEAMRSLVNESRVIDGWVQTSPYSWERKS